MIWITLVALWGLGWFNNLGGLHILLVVAAASVIYNLIRSRQATF
jgi:hypothetical protein